VRTSDPAEWMRITSASRTLHGKTAIKYFYQFLKVHQYFPLPA
jgi:hypothetical protein